MANPSRTKQQSVPMTSQPRDVVYVAVPQQQVGPDPTRMTCPHCHSRITTLMERHLSSKNHIYFAIMCMFGCWPCAPFAYCCDSCLVKKHSCPKCHQFLGIYDN